MIILHTPENPSPPIVFKTIGGLTEINVSGSGVIVFSCEDEKDTAVTLASWSLSCGPLRLYASELALPKGAHNLLISPQGTAELYGWAKP